MSLFEETVSVIKRSCGNDRPPVLALPQDILVPHECVASESNYSGAVLEFLLTFWKWMPRISEGRQRHGGGRL